MNNKTIDQIMRDQLELLAKQSADCPDVHLPEKSMAMVEIYKVLKVAESQKAVVDKMGEMLEKQLGELKKTVNINALKSMVQNKPII